MSQTAEAKCPSLHAGTQAVSDPLKRTVTAWHAACGLYYLAELAEEYTALTKRLMYAATVVVLGTHALFFLLEDLPTVPLAFGALTHVCYLLLLHAWALFVLGFHSQHLEKMHADTGGTMVQGGRPADPANVHLHVAHPGQPPAGLPGALQPGAN